MKTQCSIVHFNQQCEAPVVIESYCCGPLCKEHYESHLCPFGFHLVKGEEPFYDIGGVEL